MASNSIYWNASASPARTTTESTLPERVDVAIVGAGYTGLAAAIHLARAGRSVAVFDAEEIGHGCSSRNGGMVGPSFHQLGIAGLTSQYGEAKAHAIMQEGMNALDYFERFVAEEKLDCDLQMTGRFRGARSVAGYDATARECEKLNKAVGLPFEMIGKENQRAEIGTDFFDGGVVYHRDGGIHPRKLVNALAEKAIEAGAMLFPSTPVKGMRRDGTETEIFCADTVVKARDVLVATNGYADRRSNAMHQRVVQIRTGAIATEEIPVDLMAELSPKGRMFGESARIFMWFRPSPDGKRFIFGGRMGEPGCTPEVRAAAIRTAALRVFPQLENIGAAHVWYGDVAYTPDHSPHLGFEDGVWLAGGYCGSGVTRSLYFAMKLSRRILGEANAETAFDDLPFKKVPFKPFSRKVADLMSRWWAWRDERDLMKRA
ncbi:NAD(P)/FAD-dependent oxidoreductase [Nisaea nitritireducens]|uniref:NAD(P)/FAD-dependent oxidoreductase n=1 Tax=Nisaea nitritireducens TaxID=568392 RepID=UPI001867C727|nr:FAD-binding oxidoreductase [Nisaea nitritireducens]